MNKIFTLCILFISVTINSCGQTNINDCESLLKKEIDLNNIESFKSDFKTIMLCEFDSVDYQIIIGPQKDMVDFSIEILRHMPEIEKGKKHTYFELIQGIAEFKKTDEYTIVREIVETRNALVIKNANLSNWKEDEKALKIIRYNNEQIDIIKEIIKKNKGKTYEEIFEISNPILIEIEDKKSIEKIEETPLTNNPIMLCENVIELWTNAYTFNSYSECIDCAQKINRPILFYFSGFGSVECRKFEMNVLIEPNILNTINENFVFVTFNTDAKEELNSNDVYFSKFQEKNIETNGARNLDIQIKQFNKTNRPYFVIVSPDGSILRDYKNGLDLEKFKEFLDK